jgi:hypothetical protein
MMMKVQLQELDLRLDTDIRLGRISLAQADEIRERALIKMGLIHADFNAEKWDDVEWADPHNQARKTVIPDWEADIDWSDDFQSTKALDYLEGLAKGTETTELDSRFLLSRRHFSQLLARLGSKMSIDDFETTIHGFGEGPYPVAQSILRKLNYNCILFLKRLNLYLKVYLQTMMAMMTMMTMRNLKQSYRYISHMYLLSIVY